VSEYCKRLFICGVTISVVFMDNLPTKIRKH
jgi:hypothetical protein